MQNQIDTLRQLNYELIKNLGLFRQRAGLSFGQRHTIPYQCPSRTVYSGTGRAFTGGSLHDEPECQKADAGGFGGNISGRCRQKA